VAKPVLLRFLDDRTSAVKLLPFSRVLRLLSTLRGTKTDTLLKKHKMVRIEDREVKRAIVDTFGCAQDRLSQSLKMRTDNLAFSSCIG
jgi:hypothetical protein